MKEITDNILTVKQFTEEIELFVSQSSCSYLDALTWYAEKHNVEIETVASLVRNSHILKAKLAAESEDAKLIKRSGSKLPI